MAGDANPDRKQDQDNVLITGSEHGLSAGSEHGLSAGSQHGALGGGSTSANMYTREGKDQGPESGLHSGAASSGTPEALKKAAEAQQRVEAAVKAAAILGILNNPAGNKIDDKNLQALVQSAQRQLQADGITRATKKQMSHAISQAVKRIHIAGNNFSGSDGQFTASESQAPLGSLPADDAVTPAMVVPWQFLPIVDGTTNKVTCNPFSYLYARGFSGTLEDIANLTDNYAPNAGDYAYLELDMSIGTVITAIGLKVGTVYSAYPAFYTIDSTDVPFVDSFYLPLAKFVDPSDPNPGYIVPSGSVSSPSTLKVVPLCNQNQKEMGEVCGGLPAIVMEAYVGQA